MSDEVGPNDPNRGRSSAGGFKMPFSKPIGVRDVDDVYDAAWGGMRKPKPRDERDHQTRTDLSGGGYTPSQTSNERWKIMLIFLIVPIALLGLVAVLGWWADSTRPVPDPLTSTCEEDGYRATYRRADFHEKVTTAIFTVSLTDRRDVEYHSRHEVNLSESSAPEFDISFPDPEGFGITRCVLDNVEYPR